LVYIRAKGRSQSAATPISLSSIPTAKHTISAKTHHMRVDYSMFEGIQVTGMPDIVLSRGRVVGGWR